MGGQSPAGEFAPLLWHDNVVHGLHFEIGDPDAGDWRSELVLDIDHVVAWTCGLPGEPARFEVAPATLTFHHAGDLRIEIDCGDTGGQVALHELSIDRITRERIKDQKVCLDRPHYRWRVELNWPAGGLIGFAASGFTQVLRAEPVPSATTRLPAAHRRAVRTDRCG